MASQVFYRKWRPQLLAEVVGQQHVTQTLLNALANEKVSHAYLFCGPRGTGKTSTARSLAKAVNCLTNGKGEPCNSCDMCQAITEGRALDIIEVDAASNRGIDEIRDLREKVNYAPNQARRKVYIIDEVHMLTKEAANALLKTLEEPPPHVIFILATTEAHKLLPTILSRCQRFDFHRLTQADLIQKLSLICNNENISVEQEAMRLIAKSATGSCRDAENLLQQLTTYYGNEITLQQVKTLLGISGDQRAREVVNHIINRDIAAGIITINNVNSDGLDLRQFNRDLVEYLRSLLLVKTGSSESMELTTEDINELKELAEKASLPQILEAVKRFGELDLGLDNYSTLPLELSLVDCILPATGAKETSVRQEEPLPPSQRTVIKDSPHPVTPQAPPPEIKNTTAPEPEIPKPVVKEESKPQVSETVDIEQPAPPIAAETNEINPLSAGSAIEQLQQQWSKMINDSPDGLGKTPTAALLRSARPLSLTDDTIVIAFKYSYHKEKMDTLENQKTAEKIVSHFLGHSCRISCVYEHENNHLVKAALRMGAQVINGEEQ